MERFTVAVLVRNQFGVLNRVTSMFRRRQFNIAALTVSETESSEYSRITVLFDGDLNSKKHLVDQLYKLPDVLSIQDVDTKDAVTRELLLIKVGNKSDTRDDILAAVNAFGAQTIDYGRDSMILQLTGESSKIDAFIELMRDYDILEICRTGIVSLQRGKSTLRQSINI